MAINLPVNLGPSRINSNAMNIGKIGVPTNISRAQSTKLTTLQQKIDRSNAKVSMNQVLSSKAQDMGQRTTSIHRVGNGTLAYSSAARYQKDIKVSANDTNFYNPNADTEAREDARYDYMQRLIKARQAKQQKLSSNQSKGLSVGTGHSMHHSGAGGFHKQMGKFFRENRTKFSHLSGEQKAVLENTIENRLEHKATGSEISRYDKAAMKKEINKAHDQGKINYRTTQQFKKIVGKLGT